MNTQDPYGDISSMKSRKEYSGYDDFVPYRSDWRYGVGFFSILMIAAIAVGYWQLQPTANAPLAAAPVTKVVTKAAATNKAAVAPTAVQAEKAATPIVAAKPKAAIKQKEVDGIKQPSASTPQVKPEPFKPVTGPPSH